MHVFFLSFEYVQSCTMFNFELSFYVEYSFSTDQCREVKCDMGKVCIRTAIDKHECICKKCLPAYNMICGSDGRTYASECHMLSHNCQSRDGITKQFVGPCGKYMCL